MRIFTIFTRILNRFHHYRLLLSSRLATLGTVYPLDYDYGSGHSGLFRLLVMITSDQA